MSKINILLLSHNLSSETLSVILTEAQPFLIIILINGRERMKERVSDDRYDRLAL